MRSQIRSVLLAAGTVTALAGSASAQQSSRVAYVDVETLMAGAPGRAAAQAQIEREGELVRQEVQRMSDSMDVHVRKYQGEQASLSSSARAAREKTLQSIQGGYAVRTQALQKRAEERQNALSQQYEKQVRDAIDAVRKADGYLMVFASGPNSSLLSADTTLDITQKVLARMRVMAPAGR